MERPSPRLLFSAPMDTLIESSALALRSLIDAAGGLESVEVLRQHLDMAVARGYFRPAEEDRLMAWMGALLSVRSGLWEILEEVSEPIEGALDRVLTVDHQRLFLLGYGAACQIVKLDRFLVHSLATESLVQRKINEGDEERRIPRKQFTEVFKSLSDPLLAKWMHDAMRHAKRFRGELEALACDPTVGFVAECLEQLEQPLNPRKRRFFGLLLAYREHSLRRRGASARQKTELTLLEAAGRLVAEVNGQLMMPRIHTGVQERLNEILKPGDVLVTRHDLALSNLFLPGFWPHAALYVGSEAERQELGVELDEERRGRWRGSRRVLEARKDGVLFRALADTLEVDAVAVIRPRLEPAEIGRALSRAATHEGKMYNFDFDFFRTDRLVCTEVIYRAYDGIGAMQFELAERSGRLTLSAEDLLDLALAGEMFEPVAVFGAPSCLGELVCGAAARQALAASYQPAKGEVQLS